MSYLAVGMALCLGLLLGTLVSFVCLTRMMGGVIKETLVRLNVREDAPPTIGSMLKKYAGTAPPTFGKMFVAKDVGVEYAEAVTPYGPPYASKYIHGEANNLVFAWDGVAYRVDVGEERAKQHLPNLHLWLTRVLDQERTRKP